ncbi:MAG: CehA/McbA family metallohydrolase, partial [Planctomycetota bacterium]
MRAVDEQTREPIAVRLELRDARGRLVRVRPRQAVVMKDGVYFDGSVDLQLRRGSYTFVVEAGPEFRTRPGRFEIDRHAQDAKEVSLLRRVDMNEEGWYAGDLDVQLPDVGIELAMRARGVDWAAIASPVNRRGKCVKLRNPPSAESAALAPPFFGNWASLDHRRGGALLLLNAGADFDVCRYPIGGSSLTALAAAHRGEASVIALQPFAWDLPLWLAHGGVDAIQVIHRHSLHNGVVDSEGRGRPRDKSRYPGVEGNGRYSEAIFHQALNCGMRIAPSAGSGAGVNANALGTNRTYVHCGDACTPDSWIDGLKAGRVSVTNGPLLRTMVAGVPPGATFVLEPGQTRDFQIGLNLAFYDETHVEYLEIIKNGESLHEIRLDQLAANKGRLPPVSFDSSGWFLVRAVTDNPRTYQFATTGPYYVESAEGPRISRQGVAFLLSWLDDAAEKFADNPAVVADIEAARP